MAHLKIRPFEAVEGPSFLFAEEFAGRESSPEGTKELSPALQRWVRWETRPSPVGTAQFPKGTASVK